MNERRKIPQPEQIGGSLAAKKHDSVRPSRAGDQFHYRWAARRCLGLLDPHSDLEKITIEGVSPAEAKEFGLALAEDDGEAVIDLTEYYQNSPQVRYYQLKHSYTPKPVTFSGLKRTIIGFFKKYQQFARSSSIVPQFSYITNRPVSKEVIQFFDKVRDGEVEGKLIRKRVATIEGWLTSPNGQAPTVNDILSFLKVFWIDDTNEVHWQQRNLLTIELRGFLAGNDSEAPDRLLKLVRERVAPEYKDRPDIFLEDVLQVLGTHEEELFPAPNSLKLPDKYVGREQESEILQQLSEVNGCVVLRGDGGVGKSTLASRLHDSTPTGSTSVFFDCYGNGQYRQPTMRRDFHKTALVQISNELAAQKLCYPLIPTPLASNVEYLRAFLSRLQQAVSSLRGSDPGGKLVIYIDAADNAESAAIEFENSPSFAKDLLKEEIPEGVVLVFLCRSHRVKLLGPPHHVKQIALNNFSLNETAAHLRRFHPDATDADAREFHSQTSCNPRLQATLLESGSGLKDILSELGGGSWTLDDNLSHSLDRAIHANLESATTDEKAEIKTLLTAIAVLPPTIPLDVLSLLSNAEQSAIRSFVLDLGRPLKLTEKGVQFVDETTETWFREKHQPAPEELFTFVRKVKRVSNDDPYLATVLPTMMLRAELYDELIEMVVKHEQVGASELTTHFVARNRVHLALKAALKVGRYKDAVILAFEAGSSKATDTRVNSLVQSNLDLFGYLKPDESDRLSNALSFSTTWHGSKNLYVGSLFASSAMGERARPYLRNAERWLNHWLERSEEDRRGTVVLQDLVEFSWCALKLLGVNACFEELAYWENASTVYSTAKDIFERLRDFGEFEAAEELLALAGERQNFWVCLAGIQVLVSCFRYPKPELVVWMFSQVNFHQSDLSNLYIDGQADSTLECVLPVIQSAAALNAVDSESICRLIDEVLPSSAVRVYPWARPDVMSVKLLSLKAASLDKVLELRDLAPSQIRDSIQVDRTKTSPEARLFLSRIGAILPWCRLWAAVVRQPAFSDIEGRIQICVDETTRLLAESEDVGKHLVYGAVATLWCEVLALCHSTRKETKTFRNWIENLPHRLPTVELIEIIRVSSDFPTLREFSADFAQDVVDTFANEAIPAEELVETNVALSRAFAAFDPPEATCYLESAILEARRMGEEYLQKWDALVQIANSSGREEPNHPLALKYAAATQYLYRYVVRDKYFDWESTVAGLAKLSPASAVVTLSRWRDQKFAFPSHALPSLIETISGREIARPEVFVAFLGFDYRWPSKWILDCFDQMSDTHREAAYTIAARYTELSDAREDRVGVLNTIAEKFGFPASHVRCAAEYSPTVPTSPGKVKDWRAVFGDLDFDAPNSVHILVKEHRLSEDFFREYFQQVAYGSEHMAISALMSAPGLNVNDLNSLFESLPPSWVNRRSLKGLLAKGTKEVVKRDFEVVGKYRDYPILQFDQVERWTGLTERDVYDLVLKASGELAGSLRANRLFSLVGLLIDKTSSEEAQSTLDELLDSLGADIEDLPTAQEVQLATALAGYLWSCLASPDTRERWQAAHVVCNLIAVRAMDVLDELLAFALGKECGSFRDESLVHYELTAQIWLLYALRRSANLGYGDVVIRLAPFIQKCCEKASKHLMLRETAARLLLTLNSAGVNSLSAEEVERLENVNVSRFPIAESASYDRSLATVTDIPHGGQFHFGIDFRHYWFAGLGRIFGLSSEDIERRATRVVRSEFGVVGEGTYRADVRHERKHFNYDEIQHSHGSYPLVEDLTFYRAYHALMLVAGELVDSCPRFQDPSEDDELQEWIRSHSLSLDDGGWLADRRDKAPVLQPPIGELLGGLPNRSELFDLITDGEEIQVWGRWSELVGGVICAVNVSSAFVNPQVSRSLMRALQTTRHSNDYRLPPSDDHLEIAHGEFQLKGWISEPTSRLGLDQSDPWAGEIQYPCYAPADWFVNKFGLTVSPRGKTWYSSPCLETPAIKATDWGRKSESRYEESNYPRGARLVANLERLREWAARLNMDLLLEVKLERRAESLPKDERKTRLLTLMRATDGQFEQM